MSKSKQDTSADNWEVSRIRFELIEAVKTVLEKIEAEGLASTKKTPGEGFSLFQDAETIAPADLGSPMGAFPESPKPPARRQC
jgi:hypothetical protein